MFDIFVLADIRTSPVSVPIRKTGSAPPRSFPAIPRVSRERPN